MRCAWLTLLGLLAACPFSAPSRDAGVDGGAWVLRGATIVNAGEPAVVADVTVEGDSIIAVGTSDPSLPGVDAGGAFVAPAFIDSHVHLAFRNDPGAVARAGVAGVVDLAAPVPFLDARQRLLAVKAAGPMVTAPAGYPTQSWGRFGYGFEVDGGAEAIAAVDYLAGKGAAVIKVPVGTDGPTLPVETLRLIAARAHAHGLKVAAHALSLSAAAEAADAGADVLVHSPLELLDGPTVEAWRGRAMTPSLLAFGGSDEAVRNLRALRDAGVVVLYGTDFGNGPVTGIDASEVALWLEAGVEPEALLEAGTVVPARYWGFERLGRVAVGKAASFLVLDADPRLAPLTLTRPVRVYINGATP